MTDRPPSPQTRRRVDPDAGSSSITVLIRDEQDEGVEHLPVDERRWSMLCASVLEHQGIDRSELSVAFVGPKTMAELNHRYLGHDGSTDVLAFPIGDDETAGAPTELPSLLGDVVICPAVAVRNAPDHAGTYEDEVALLLVHGVLHLLGMDHSYDTDRELMQHRERDLLELYHGELALDPWS